MKYLSLTFLMLVLVVSTYGQNNLSVNNGPEGTFDEPENVMPCLSDAYSDQVIDLGNLDNASTSDLDAGFLVADRFQVPADVTIGSICYWGVSLDFGTFTECGPHFDFQITYWTGDAAPDAIYAGPFDVVSNTEGTGDPFAFLEIINHEVTHDPVNLIGGTNYWLSIQATDGTTCSWLWIDNAGSGDGVATQIGGVVPVPVPDYSFVLGEYVETPSVPTMGEWGLMSLGLLLLIFGIVAVRERKIALG